MTYGEEDLVSLAHELSSRDDLIDILNASIEELAASVRLSCSLCRLLIGQRDFPGTSAVIEDLLDRAERAEGRDSVALTKEAAQDILDHRPPIAPDGKFDFRGHTDLITMLAEKHGTVRSNISRIWRRQAWSHLKRSPK